MAEVKVVNHGQTGSTASSTLSLTGKKPTPKNLLVAMISQQGTRVNPPTIEGWTVGPSAGETGATAGLFVAWREATGAETEINVTPGAEGNIQGITYVEASGAKVVSPMDESAASGKQSSSTTHESGELNTHVPGDLIFAAFGLSALSSCEATGWTELTNSGTTATRCPGAYAVVPGTLSKQKYTVTLAAARAGGVFVVALKPEEGTTPAGAITQGVGVAQKPTGDKLAQAQLAPSVAVGEVLASRKLAQGVARQSLAAGQASTATSARRSAVTQLTAAAQRVISGTPVVRGALAQLLGASQAAPGQRQAQGALSQVPAVRSSTSARRVAQGGQTQNVAAAGSTSARRTGRGGALQALALRNVTAALSHAAGALAQRVGLSQFVSAKPPPPLRVGPITLGEGDGTQDGIDLGPTTGEAR